MKKAEQIYDKVIADLTFSKMQRDLALMAEKLRKFEEENGPLINHIDKNEVKKLIDRFEKGK